MTEYAVYKPIDPRTSEDTRRLQADILEMRAAGMSFPQIGRALGYSQRYVYKLYENAIQQILVPGVENLRKLEAERLDAMLVPCMSKIMAARNAAIANQPFATPDAEIVLALRIAERRAKLYGLDLPTDTPKPAKNGSGASPDDIFASLNLSAVNSEELKNLRDLLIKAMPDGAVRGGS